MSLLGRTRLIVVVTLVLLLYRHLSVVSGQFPSFFGDQHNHHYADHLTPFQDRGNIDDLEVFEPRQINFNGFRMNNTRRPLFDFRDSRSFSQLTSLIRPTFYRPSLFHVVKFPNDECLDATNQTGVCYTALECKAYGGTGSTSCAKGYGTCCSINRSCNQVTSNRVVYFMNPSYPQSDTQSTYCAFTVEVRDPDVCQVRLDFLEFNIDQPTDGFCYGDRLTVTAGGLNARSIPILCGNNKDQHMYVNIPKGARQRSASLLVQTNGNGAYRWRIRVTHVSCIRTPAEAGLTSTQTTSMSSVNLGPPYNANRRSDQRSERMLSKFRLIPMAALKVTIPAPAGCLQYFTEPSGTIMSFNYGHYLSNMDYAICIERLPTTCKVVFRAVDTFGISMSTGSRQFTAGVGDTECLYDYLSVPGGSRDGMRETRDRRCGTILSNFPGSSTPEPVVTRSNGPIVLRFHTDSRHDRSVKAGFKLFYEQSSNCEQILTEDGQNPSSVNPFNTIGTVAAAHLQMYTPTPMSTFLEPETSVQTNKLFMEDQLSDRESRSRSNAKRWKF